MPIVNFCKPQSVMSDLSTSALKIALCQMNSTVGDFAGNAAKIREAALCAQKEGAGLVVTPEMSLTGYPIEDWGLRDDFCEIARKTLVKLAQDVKTLVPVLVGTVWVDETGVRRNALALLRNGRVDALHFKNCLPNYGVFDEPRVFTAADKPTVIDVDGVKLGLAICEDVWHSEFLEKTRAAGAQIIVAANASPFESGKIAERERTVLPFVKSHQVPILYVNAIGGQDELVFDGSSFATDLGGRVFRRLKRFEEDLLVVSVQDLVKVQPSVDLLRGEQARLQSLYEALKLALKDYVTKNGFRQVVIGLSGGIDSALVTAIAVDALGAENVLTVMMPTQFTVDLSFDLAKQLVENLEVKYIVRPIGPLFEAYRQLLAEDFAGKSWDVTEENLQARIRGTLLMAYANKFNRLVITTGNKSETAVGYSTLYGDTAGAFALIKDVYKTDVWALARYLNQLKGGEVIPDGIINRAPSAELRKDQKDEDSLPAYERLDAILNAYVDQRMSLSQIQERSGSDRQVNERIVRLIRRNEYKRRQSPLGPKLSGIAFGRDWRYPVTGK